MKFKMVIENSESLEIWYISIYILDVYPCKISAQSDYYNLPKPSIFDRFMAYKGHPSMYPKHPSLGEFIQEHFGTPQRPVSGCQSPHEA